MLHAGRGPVHALGMIPLDFDRFRADRKWTLRVVLWEPVMKASFLDLRKKSGEIRRALERNERVTVFYRGKPKAVMQPAGVRSRQRAAKVKEHPAYGLWVDRRDMKDVPAHVRGLRKGRFHDL